jgi:hypothetical protein
MRCGRCCSIWSPPTTSSSAPSGNMQRGAAGRPPTPPPPAATTGGSVSASSASRVQGYVWLRAACWPCGLALCTNCKAHSLAICLHLLCYARKHDIIAMR